MNPFKKLAGETVIYGFTTILSRFVNFLLVPLYTGVFAPAEYGVSINLMAYVALLQTLLTYGTETGFFRFASNKDLNKVFSSLITSLFFTTLLFILLVFGFKNNIASFLDIRQNPEYITILAVVIGLDVINSIPFALLRFEGRPIRFGFLRVTNILINIASNLFFLKVCPWLEMKGIHVPFYNVNGGILYIFISYLIANIVTFIMLLPSIKNIKFSFSSVLLKEILIYSWPVMIVSLAGMFNLQGDKILMPKVLEGVVGGEEAKFMTGIYGANYKLATIMVIFTQGFRYAFEPFFFKYAKNEDAKTIYKQIFLYFTGFGLLIVIGMMYWLDILKYFIRTPEYYVGLVIVPWLLLGNLFQGMYYSLSLWYKLTDKTMYGAYMAIVGCIVTLVINIVFLPKIGYIAAAYGVFACFLVMCILSLILGARFYKIRYDIKKVVIYFILALLLLYLGGLIQLPNEWATCFARTPLLLMYIYIFVKYEMSFLIKGKLLSKIFGKK